MDFPVSGHSHVMLATRKSRSARRAPERKRVEFHASAIEEPGNPLTRDSLKAAGLEVLGFGVTSLERGNVLPVETARAAVEPELLGLAVVSGPRLHRQLIHHHEQIDPGAAGLFVAAQLIEQVI